MSEKIESGQQASVDVLEGNRIIHGNYTVNRNGSIQNKDSVFIKLGVGSSGYVQFNAYSKGHMRTFSVHRLVAMAYHPNPLNLPEVNHKDGNKLNNNDWNLEWSTRSNNILHGFRTGLIKKSMVGRKGGKHWASKVVVRIFNNETVAEYESTGLAADATGFNKGSIQDACKGRLKTYKGHIWKYKE